MNTIKSPFLLFFATLFVFSFSSCSKDDDTAAPAPAPTQLISSNTLVGEWGMTSLDYAGESTTTSGGVDFTTGFSGVGKDFTYAIIFNDNPKTYTTSGGYTVALTTLLSGGSFVQDVTLSNVNTSGTWELNGNQFTVVDDSNNESSTTEILSASSNSFSMDFEGLFGKSVGGANVTFSSGQVTYNRK